VKEEIDEELRFHIEQRTGENTAAGMSPVEAAREARKRFGNWQSVREDCRDARSVSFGETMLKDIRFGMRMLRRNPGFTAVAMLTLALGIGANTAIFSIVDGVLLKPLPYEQPGQLVQVWEAPAPGKRIYASPGAFLDWRQDSTVFEALSIADDTDRNLPGDGDPERVSGLAMSASGLQILRARPLFGRTFAPDEDQPGKDKVVVLTHGFWQRRFGGETNIVGRTIQLSDQSYTVIGVLPPRFLLGDKTEFVVPTGVAPADADQRAGHSLQVIGRLKPGVTVEQAQTEMNVVAARLRPLYPPHKQDWGVILVPMHEQITGRIRPTLLVLFGAVGFVLLIACANVANLLLAKASGRQKEIAIRTALGASRGRVIRQLLMESVLLSAMGAMLGLLLAFGTISAVRNLRNVDLPRAHELGLDLRVLGFAVLASLLAGVAFGLVPALQTSRPNLNDMLKDGARTSGSGPRSRVRSGLIVAEVALSLVLLIGAGLLLNSFVRLSNVSSGINPRNVLTMQVTLPEKKYPDYERRAAFFERVLERIGSLPGVEAAGVAGTMPLAGWSYSTSFSVIGRREQPASGYATDHDVCTHDYFRAVGIPLRKGRFFDQRDRGGASRAVVISEALAREHFPNEEPLGQRIHLDVLSGKIDEGWEIVGVVGDVRQHGLGEAGRPCVYRQASRSTGNLVVRTTGAPLAMAESVRKAILEVDPSQPVANVRTMDDVLAASMGQRRFVMTLLGGFAGAALLLAAIGLYGVIAYAVQQRTREIGIRMALGATRRDVVSLVLRQGIKLAGIGVVVGIAAALGLTRVLTKLLYEVKPIDLPIFTGVSLVLLAVALLASWLPARRAAKVDPMVALRYE
jgi:putative ABC transport system permease protein